MEGIPVSQLSMFPEGIRAEAPRDPSSGEFSPNCIATVFTTRTNPSKLTKEKTLQTEGRTTEHHCRYDYPRAPWVSRRLACVIAVVLIAIFHLAVVTGSMDAV